jgi:hypothetical protein
VSVRSVSVCVRIDFSFRLSLSGAPLSTSDVSRDPSRSHRESIEDLTRFKYVRDIDEFKTGYFDDD